MENKLYLTTAEAKAKGLPSVAEQIERHNRLMAEIHTRSQQVPRGIAERVADQAEWCAVRDSRNALRDGGSK
jgi:hypothetical protein